MREDFKTLVEKYMLCDKRTLAEMLALRDMGTCVPVAEPEPKPQPFVLPDNWDFPWEINDPVNNPYTIRDPLKNPYTIGDPIPTDMLKIYYANTATSTLS